MLIFNLEAMLVRVAALGGDPLHMCLEMYETNVSQCVVRDHLHPQHPRPKCSIDFTGMRLLGISQAVKGPVHTDNKRTNMGRSQVSPTCPKVQYDAVLQQTFGEQPRVGYLRAWSFGWVQK